MNAKDTQQEGEKSAETELRKLGFDKIVELLLRGEQRGKSILNNLELSRDDVGYLADHITNLFRTNTGRGMELVKSVFRNDRTLLGQLGKL